MTSLERVLAALSHREADRVPLFLLLTGHGARELGLGLRDYLTSPRAIAEAQPRMRARLGHDCLYGFTYAALELEAWGGEVLWSDDGPPNGGAPLVRTLDEVAALQPPRVAESRPLQRALEGLSRLRDAARGEVPVLGAVLSPFSLPVLQLGFERYLELLLDRRDLLDRLLRVNEAFCVEWANAQLAAGATALAWFDPLASPTCVPPALFREVALPVLRRTMARIRGPLVAHLASARVLPIAADLLGLGVAGLTCGADDPLAALKQACSGRAAVVGGLDGVAMRRWQPADAERAVREAIAAAAPGGGFVLAEQHGEVPFSVPDAVLGKIAEAVRVHGRYPIGAGAGAFLPAAAVAP